MRIDEILKNPGPCFSFEFFPPKTDEGQRNLEQALSELKKDSPDYVSVTYGAAGSTRERTVEVTKWIKEDLGLEAMAHLSCVGEPVERLREILDEVAAAGVDNVLALRGDPPRGEVGLDPSSGRARVLGRPDRADPGQTTTTASAPPAFPRCTPRRPTSITTCAT